ncbi:hypothetical protein GGR20_003715 [Devosia subaequoris]|uniref:Helicase HerA central domain-containing protein n=1 Tax=Devosia subaequoris TaxID=395930 RepID=A0A7W6NDI3_9HYPH|nr:hypothetical protein [Devosia subaequoris]MCP1211561.1 DUF87 domain-containing protein [Devosia subaequoris]
MRLTLDAPQSIALNAGVPTAFPRVNSYVLLPNEAGATVGLVSRIWVTEAGPVSSDDRFVALPFPTRRLAVTPVGTLLLDGENYQLERGVTALPGVGDIALIPSASQLKSIVEGNGEDRRLLLGTAPFGNNSRVMVDPDKLFGRHLAVLGNTGSGKSCTVAGLVRWSMEAAQAQMSEKVGPRSRFIILDPNGEYGAAFQGDYKNVRRFVVGKEEGAVSLAVPAWLWNGQEWSAFTDAKPGSQRPLLLKSLRTLRNAMVGDDAFLGLMRRTVGGHLTLLRQMRAGYPQSVQEWRDNKSLAEQLAGIASGLRSDRDKLDDQSYMELRAALTSVAGHIEGVLAGKEWSPGKYNTFQQTDIDQPISWLADDLLPLLPLEATYELGEDNPTEFDISALPIRLNEMAIAQGSGAVQHVEPLVNRIEVMLSDSRMRPIVSPEPGSISLLDFLAGFLGDDSSHRQVVIVDLSLVPSDVVHIAVSVIARLTFEALQRYRKANAKPLPTTIVLEEAHTFVRKDGEYGLSAPAADTCRQTFERVAREGRKFGLGLVLSSQRPSELSPTVLAQCNSFLLHRLVNDTDQALVRKLVPDALGELLGELPTLPSQQAILLGWAAPLPVLVRMRDLPKHQRPQSDDPDYWDVWTRKVDRPVNWQPIVEDWQT